MKSFNTCIHQLRRSLSRTSAYNIFNLNLKYFFGPQAYETKLIKKVKMTTNSFGLLPEILIRLIKTGYSYKELPYYTQEVPYNSTTAFRVKNISDIIMTILRLFFEINIKSIFYKILALFNNEKL